MFVDYKLCNALFIFLEIFNNSLDTGHHIIVLRFGYA